MLPNKISIEVERDPHTGLIPCTACTQCCQYVAIEIDTPEDRKDFDNIRWYLYHPGVEVYIDHDDTWNVIFHSRCENLQNDGKCGIYETRPIICRDFSVHTCEPNTGEPAEKVLFRTAADLEDWMRLTRTDVVIERMEKKKEERRRRRAEARERARGAAARDGKGRAVLGRGRPQAAGNGGKSPASEGARSHGSRNGRRTHPVRRGRSLVES